MSRNGSGVYSRVPGSAYTSGTVADGAELDAEMNDLASALTGSLAANGETAWTGNHNAGAYTISNVVINTALNTTSAIATATTKVVAPTAELNSVKFPATQSASSDANTLDDYEEGNWTPTGNGVTYTVAAATYVKIGRLVVASFDLTWPVTADTAAAQIQSLPFTSANAFFGGTIGYCEYSTTAAYIDITNSATICAITAPGGGTISNASFSGKRLIASLMYLSVA